MNSCRLCSESNGEWVVRYYSMKQLLFLVLESIPLNFLMLYFVLANEKCTGRFVLEIFDTGKYVPVH